MQLTKNFNLAEFACHDGAPVPASLMANVKLLAENLQVLRDAIGEPLRINSGYRTAAYNKKIGGKPKSLHLSALAADIAAKSLTPRQLAARIESLIKAGKMRQGGIGIYKSWVHYDCRGVKVRW